MPTIWPEVRQVGAREDILRAAQGAMKQADRVAKTKRFMEESDEEA